MVRLTRERRAEIVRESAKKNHLNKMSDMIYYAKKLLEKDRHFLTRRYLQKETGFSQPTIAKYWDEVLEAVNEFEIQQKIANDKFYNYEPETEIDPTFLYILKGLDIEEGEATALIDELNQRFDKEKIANAFKKIKSRKDIKNPRIWLFVNCENAEKKEAQEKSGVVRNQKGFRPVELTPEIMGLSEERIKAIRARKEKTKQKLFEPI